MALNKTILIKLTQKTGSDPVLEAFLVRLFEFESEPRGWYKTLYSQILEEAFSQARKENIGDAHNET